MAKKYTKQEKQDNKKRQQTAAEIAEKKRIKLAKDEARAFVQVSNTEAGRILFRKLMRDCGFITPSVVADPATGEIFTDSTVYNEARRNLYLSWRKQVPLKHLVKIEFNLEAAPDDDDED